LELSCFSSDIQEVTVKYTINYQIDKANAMNIYRSIGESYYATIISPNVVEAVKEVAALYTAENLINCREELSNAIETILAERLAQYDIKIVNTACEDMDFSDVFTDAVEAKQVAQQNKLKAETEAEQRVIEAEAAAQIKKVEAEAQAEAAKISADAEAYQITAKAEAEAEANKKVAESLTDALIDYQYAQSWNGQLPTYMSGDNGIIPILDVKK
jgi:regulator of protease activity HflC (stomatin/prohibitin superfamily)